MLQSSDLKKYRYFSSLSRTGLDVLSGKLRTVQIPRGMEIVKEGAIGDEFYFVRDGRLEVTKRTKNGGEAKLSVIGSGQGFGEMALLTCSIRSCSVRAMTDATLYALSKADFEQVLLNESAFKNALLRRAEDYEQYNRIKMLQPFALLEPDRMYALMHRMSERIYFAGEDIIVQGERGDFYYIIKSGRVEVLKKGKGEALPKQVAILTDGDGFGEEALIRDDPRNATCRAMVETTVFALDKADFNQIVKSSFLEYVFAEDIDMEKYRDKYLIIDARVPAEFEEEHIAGAVNIPMEVLRQKFTELDPSKEYITYCTNDSRGMVSAFLLRNHGFKAKCLRGGVSSWTGPTVSESTGVHLPLADHF